MERRLRRLLGALVGVALAAMVLAGCAESTPSEEELVAELMTSGYDSVSASCFVIELRKAVGLERARHLDELSPDQLARVRAAADRCLYQPQAARQAAMATASTTTIEPAPPIGRAEGIRQLVELGGYSKTTAECLVDVLLATGIDDLSAAFASDPDAVRLRAEAAGACSGRG